jgi:hypothetical protein
MRKIIYSFLLLASTAAHAQLKVGDNPTTLNASSVLEIESTDKGLLMPRIALTATNSASPLITFVNGMVVYNTATAGTAPNNVTPGIYYSDGSKWVSVTMGNTQIGDIKTGFQTADHAGWVKLNGRLKSTLTATQQANATALGIGANLPDATDKVLKQKSGVVNTTGGSNTSTILQANLPNISLTASSSGAHSHTFGSNTGGSYGPGGITPQTLNGGITYSTSSAGAHTHSVPLGGSGTALSVEDAYLSANVFIYLGN